MRTLTRYTALSGIEEEMICCLWSIKWLAVLAWLDWIGAL